MRRALRSLTLRGRAFLASGITAVVCGLVLLERDLSRMGLLVAALPLVAAGFVLRRAHHVSVRRTVSPERITVGERARVEVTVANGGPATGMLLLEEELPAELGGRPRFVIGALGRGETARLEYAVTASLRGRHRLGPLSARRREPFGMVEVLQQLPGTDELLVLPQVVPLPALRLAGDRFTSGEEAPRSYAAGNVADVIVREYRRGDDLRRVHWRSTARTGELMVRNEEQLFQARATVVLDNRAQSHRGTGAGSSLERAVVAAASVVVHLTSLGYQVRLVTTGGVVEARAERGRPADATVVLESLALVRADHGRLPDLVQSGDAALGVVVGVLGETRPADHAWWHRVLRRGTQGLALVLDVADWGQRPVVAAPAPARPPSWLAEQGWRAGLLTRSDALATAWKGLDL